MGSSPPPPEIVDLIPLYAIDALDGAERDLVEDAVEAHPRLRHEVDAFREVMAAVAAASVTPPADLWPRVAAGLDDTPPLRLVPVAKPKARVPLRRSWLARSGLVAAAAAATVLLAVQNVDQSRQVDGLQRAISADGLDQVADIAFADPNSSVHSLQNVDGVVMGDVAVTPDGDAFLTVTPSMQPLPAEQTYQLWALTADGERSVSIMGPSPTVVAFHAPAGATGFAITIEPAAGSVSPSGPVAAQALA